MVWLKHITTLMLCVSIAFAGFPAQAKPQPECPMATKMQIQQMDMQDMKDCKGCDDIAKQEPKKNDCCDESGCNAKCPAMSGGVVMNLPTYKTDVPAISGEVQRLYPADATMASAHLNSQERPPRSLA